MSNREREASAESVDQMAAKLRRMQMREDYFHDRFHEMIKVAYYEKGDEAAWMRFIGYLFFLMPVVVLARDFSIFGSVIPFAIGVILIELTRSAMRHSAIRSGSFASARIAEYTIASIDLVDSRTKRLPGEQSSDQDNDEELSSEPILH